MNNSVKMSLLCDNFFDSETGSKPRGRSASWSRCNRVDSLQICLESREEITTVARTLGEQNLILTEKLLPRSRSQSRSRSRSRSPRHLKSQGASGGRDVHPRHRFRSVIRRLHLNMRKRHENVEEDQATDQIDKSIEDYIIPDVEPTLTSMNDLSLNDSEVFIGDPEVNFGMKIETIEELGYIRHICVDVESGGLADQFNFRNIDELLMINSDAVFNKTQEEVLKLFSGLRTAEAITMITRRYLDIENIFEDRLQDKDIQVQYFRITGEVLVTEEEDKKGKLERRLSVSIKQEIFEETFESAKFIQVTGGKDLVSIEKTSSPPGVLKFKGEKLSIRPGNIDTEDKSLEFETLICYAGDGLRHFEIHIIKAADSNHFLQIGSDNSVTMEERDVDGKGAPCDLTGLLFQPKNLTFQQIYKVYSDDPDESRYLKWDAEAGVAVEENDQPGGDPDFTFKVHEFNT